LEQKSRENKQKTALKRSVTLPFLVCYGLGTILGAGIYVLVGKVAGMAGPYTPFSFMAAAIVATFTAYSYAKLSSKYPKSAGEAVYVQEAFHKQWLSRLVGWLIIFTGIVSAATIANGFVGYLHIFVNIPDFIAIVGLILLLGFLAFWGIEESMYVAAIITLVEISGLGLVIFAAAPEMANYNPEYPPLTLESTTGIFLGAFLAFYAYIGFEDMVNIAEEVTAPARTLPLAIGISLLISTLMYGVISYAALASIPIDVLSESEAPLAIIVENAGYSPKLIGLISLFAVINGALVQIIMAARVTYGMASQGMMHQAFAQVHPTRRTPAIATVAVTVLVLVFALIFPLVTLAKLTSLIILCVFSLVNLSYFVISHKRNYVSLTGFFLCLLLLALQGLAK